jgi:hypothetical protein
MSPSTAPAKPARQWHATSGRSSGISGPWNTSMSVTWVPPSAGGSKCHGFRRRDG